MGFGNELRGDDGVGLAAQRLLAAGSLPQGVRCADVGIGGVALVHELQEGCDRLVIIDAVKRGGAPGTVYVLEPRLPALVAPRPGERDPLLVDAHMAEPYSALVLSRALGVLPNEVRVVAVEVLETDELTMELTPAVARAVPIAARRALELATEVLVA